jgi:hypothetical protein
MLRCGCAGEGGGRVCVCPTSSRIQKATIPARMRVRSRTRMPARGPVGTLPALEPSLSAAAEVNGPGAGPRASGPMQSGEAGAPTAVLKSLNCLAQAGTGGAPGAAWHTAHGTRHDHATKCEQCAMRAGRQTAAHACPDHQTRCRQLRRNRTCRPPTRGGYKRLHLVRRKQLRSPPRYWRGPTETVQGFRVPQCRTRVPATSTGEQLRAVQALSRAMGGSLAGKRVGGGKRGGLPRRFVHRVAKRRPNLALSQMLKQKGPLCEPGSGGAGW